MSPLVASGSLRPSPFPLGSHPFSSVAKTRLALTYRFNGESIHSSSKGWRSAVGGTIALSGRFRLIESGRDKEERKKKRPRQRGKLESGLKLVERVTAGGLKEKYAERVDTKCCLRRLPPPSPSTTNILYLIPYLSRATFNVYPFFITHFPTVGAFSARFSIIFLPACD